MKPIRMRIDDNTMKEMQDLRTPIVSVCALQSERPIFIVHDMNGEEAEYWKLKGEEGIEFAELVRHCVAHFLTIIDTDDD